MRLSQGNKVRKIKMNFENVCPLARIGKFQLSSMFFSNVETILMDSAGKVHRGFINAIQKEDGSGKSFNVTIGNNRGTETFHLRTLD
jgi:hypothetical protein